MLLVINSLYWKSSFGHFNPCCLWWLKSLNCNKKHNWKNLANNLCFFMCVECLSRNNDNGNNRVPLKLFSLSKKKKGLVFLTSFGANYLWEEVSLLIVIICCIWITCHNQVVLKESSSPHDMLKSLFQVNYLYWLERNAGIEARSISADCRPEGRLQISLEYARREFNHVKNDSVSMGWVADGLIARPSPIRVCPGNIASSIASWCNIKL